MTWKAVKEEKLKSGCESGQGETESLKEEVEKWRIKGEMMKEDLRKCSKWGANINDEATEEEDSKE